MPPVSARHEGPLDEALRVTGRLAVFGGLAVAMVFLTGIFLKPVLPAGLPPGEAGAALLRLLWALSLLGATLVVGATFERGRWRVAGFAPSGMHPVAFVVGLGIGIASALLPGVALLLAGQATLAPADVTRPWGETAGAAAWSLGVATLVEALVAFGYLQGLLEARWGRLVSVGLPAALFAAASLRHPGAGALTVAGAGALGLLLAAVRERTGSVVPAWLAAAGFAVVQAAVWHAPVRGASVGVPAWYQWAPAGPTWASGGGWGLEASLVTAATLVLVSFLVLRPRRPARRTTPD